MKYRLNEDKTILYITDRRFNLKSEYDKYQAQDLFSNLPKYLKMMK